jgi:hypothetical protein
MPKTQTQPKAGVPAESDATQPTKPKASGKPKLSHQERFWTALISLIIDDLPPKELAQQLAQVSPEERAGLIKNFPKIERLLAAKAGESGEFSELEKRAMAAEVRRQNGGGDC